MQLARLRMLAATLATLGAVLGAAFVLQAAVFGRPGPAPALVAHVLARLSSYHVAQARMTIDGTRLSAACRQTWRGRLRIAAVRVAGGPTIVEVGNKLGQLGGLEFGEFELAGCPRPLARWLANQVNLGAHIDVTSEELDGRAVYALSVPSSAFEFEVFVTRAGGLPVALRYEAARIHGTSELHYGLALPAPGAGSGAAHAAARR